MAIPVDTSLNHILVPWADPEVQALVACRTAASAMLSSLASGDGCNPADTGTQGCRQFGKALENAAVQSFQGVWSANVATFAQRFLTAFPSLPPAYKEALKELKTDGVYGPQTAHALQFIGYALSDRSDSPPDCACQMQAYLATPVGGLVANQLTYPVGSEAAAPAVPAVPAPTPDPAQQVTVQPGQQITMQPQQVTMQPAVVAGSVGRQTNATVYWGIGILALLAAGGTWYYLKGRKGRR
jgi:hypothetical protein